MRLHRLLIEKYGNLERAELSFDPAPGRINLLLAPNGAGKSVLRQAFHDLLFGIPLQSDMKFRFDYPGMHLCADAVSQDGAEFTFGWQRKAGRIFPNAGTDPAASRWLAELTAAVTPRQVEMLFALDTDRLRAGGKELATGDGTLGSALLSGTGELASARTLRRALDTRRAAIWERSKSSRPLNAALARLAGVGKQQRDALRTPKMLGTLQAEIHETQTRKSAAGAELEAAQAQLSRLNRIELTRGPVAELLAATAWLTAHPNAPTLPDGFADQLARARHEASLAATRLDAAREQRRAAEARAAQSPRDPAADAADPALSKLSGALGDADTKRRDSAALVTKRAEALVDVAAALRDIGSTIPPDQAGSVIPTLPAMSAAREQINHHTAAATTLKLAQARLEKADAALALLAAEGEAAPVLAQDELDALLAEIRRDRDPLAHAAELAQAAREAAASERACVAKLPFWGGDPAGLAAMTPATEPAYERLATALAGTQDQLNKATADRDRLQAQRTQWEASLASLRQQPLPDAAALATARAERDRGWSLIYARAFAGRPDEAAERLYAGDQALPLMFERHLRAADAIADARIDELARVEQAARLTADITASEPAWALANTAIGSATQQHAAAAQRWTELCAPLRLAADATLREVFALLAARAESIEARRVSELATGARDAVIAQHAAWADRLSHLCGTPGSLAALLPLADAKVQAARLAQKAELARDARRTQSEAERRAATIELASAQDRLAAWQQGWDATLLQLGRPPVETPEVTGRVLARLGEMDQQHRAGAGLQLRIDDMRADIAAFANMVAALAADLAIPPGSDPFATAELLITRRDTARSLASAAKEAERAQTDAATLLEAATQKDRDTAAILAAVLAGCGAPDVATAEHRIEAARERSRQDAIRTAATSRLAAIGGGASLDQLAAELAALPTDQFDAERRVAEAALTRARTQEQEAAIALSTLERQYDADAAATGASEAAESEAAIAAEAGRLLDEYLLLRVASGMLGRALDRVEESAGPTGVQRIAAAFEAITGGTWTIRASENARGETTLQAVERAANELPKQIDQLSEGTRDQLYLALRLVAIESHVAAAPPLPFIADDILQTFDDTRAHAAMQALVGLSQHVQVIVLTHHPHLLEIAKTLPVHAQTL
ncbi:AAA family ATPase [Acidisphaera sp. L21]|uniref:AAA family ATPase n=1 Tax=Acidisphaera sp. L21 TaxID=1641851 RepID=UPI00131A897F|nr:AAA family ATPase [Acidisphaera sp. L21]